MSGRKAPRRSPRRKAGRVRALRAKRAIAFRLVVEGQEMRVRYTPDPSSDGYAHGHFEFMSPHKPPRRIAVSETGYRSHFAPMEEIAEAKSPQDYARELVLAFLNRDRRGASYVSCDQLSLF